MTAPPPLHGMIYRSRSALTGTPREVASALGGILDVSRRRNAEDGVTGALLLRESVFAQVLEGPAAAVAETFARISADPRHSAITVLEDTPATTQIFAQWSMAYAGDGGMPDIPLTFGLDDTRFSAEQAAIMDRLRSYAGTL